jgi:hypothetical protein
MLATSNTFPEMVDLSSPDLTHAGYVVKEKDGRRNRYRIQSHLPLPGAIGQEQTIGDVLGVLVDARA